MKKYVVGLSAAALLSAAPALVQAAPITVNALGVAGWESGDTRPAAGGVANAAQIAAQIKFLGDGQVVADAAGGTPSVNAAGTLNGNGAVRLDGTSTNAGKSDIGFLDANGLGAASVLLGADFTASYRSFSDPNGTLRTVGFGIALSNGLSNCGAFANAACYYTFSHTDPDINPANPNKWLTETVGATSGNFSLYGAGAPNGAVGAPSKTLADWATDATWGFLFNQANDYDVVRLNFNIGSSSRFGLVYVDWVQSNLLNGGDMVDFVSADFVAVPEPGGLALAGLALLALVGTRRRAAR